jgi:hypothetical protein
MTIYAAPEPIAVVSCEGQSPERGDPFVRKGPDDGVADASRHG